ncbi:MAG: hypothetical protein Q7V63_05410 [Gammaproteobacteria bacterium]|nr:hypothetical protein [Gammaproteobacteria bacterium]
MAYGTVLNLLTASLAPSTNPSASPSPSPHSPQDFKGSLPGILLFCTAASIFSICIVMQTVKKCRDIGKNPAVNNNTTALLSAGDPVSICREQSALIIANAALSDDPKAMTLELNMI